jgi:Zn-finger nucleic acid-binding protein
VQCPVDSTNLLMAERHGVEIDCCPECRGIWLDRGGPCQWRDFNRGDLTPERLRECGCPKSQEWATPKPRPDVPTSCTHRELVGLCYSR